VILLFAILIVAAVLSTKVTSRFGVPVLVAFLGIGLVVGSDVLNLIHFDDAALTRRIADILLVFIIFEGGFQTSRRDLAAVAGPALTLATRLRADDLLFILAAKTEIDGIAAALNEPRRRRGTRA